MKLIQDNPYRIAGILANATERDVVRQKGKISKSAGIGRQVDSELDFPFMNTVDRTDLNSVNKAFSGIEQNQDKVSHSLFWFIMFNSFDGAAINYLINGNKEKAIEIWEKVTNGKEVTSKNFSCFNNIGTLKLLSNSKDKIQEGLEAKIKLIESSSFADFVHTVADQTYTIDNQKQVEKFVDELLKQFKGKYSSLEILKLFSNCNRTTQQYLSQKFTEEPIYKIESQIETCKEKRKANKGKAYEYGFKLYTSAKDDLTLVKSILGIRDLRYSALADQLANEILQCGIDHFNESQKNNSSENYLESSLKLSEIANSIAVGKIARDRAKDSLATLEDMKDQEINKAIALLNSIKTAYEKEINKIDVQVAKMRITLLPNQTINYSKVDKMKEDCLDWNKVVKIVSDKISRNDVEVIQLCSNQTKVTEYKTLVNFLIGRLGPMQINQIKYICYWRNVKTAQIKSTVKEVGETIDTASSGCYIATMAYGNYDHPNVLELRRFRDEILTKLILGRRFIRFYYKYSPLLVERLKDKPKTNNLIRILLNQLIKTIRKL